MTQAEVLEFLKKNPNTWFSAKEIALKFKKSKYSISENLRRLRRTNFIIVQDRASYKQSNIYKYKYNL